MQLIFKDRTMKPSKINTDFNGHLETRLNVLLKIRDFQDDLKITAERISSLSERLIQNYSTGLVYLSQHLNTNEQQKFSDLLTNIQVNANNMNHILDKTIYFNSEDEIHSCLNSQIKIFEERKDRMIDYSRRFELLAKELLEPTQVQIWEANFCQFDEKFCHAFESYSQTLRIIGEVYQKYSPKEIKLLSQIIAQNQDKEWNNEEYEIEYLKAISQFKQEFHPENLWDKFLDVLAGGVHPSPEEKVMLSRWMDGEQKSKPGE